MASAQIGFLDTLNMPWRLQACFVMDASTCTWVAWSPLRLRQASRCEHLYSHFWLVHTRLTHNFALDKQKLLARCVKYKIIATVSHVQHYLSSHAENWRFWVMLEIFSYYITSGRKHTSTWCPELRTNHNWLYPSYSHAGRIRASAYVLRPSEFNVDAWKFKN